MGTPAFNPRASYDLPAFDPKASYVPAQAAPVAIDLSNKQGQGTYAMWDTAGHKLDVPYGQVQTAAQQGYKFDTNANKSGLTPGQQFQKDYNYATTGPGHEESYAQSDKNAPLPMQAISGVVKGIGTIGKPVMDLVGAAGRIPQESINQGLTAQTPMELAGKSAVIGAATAPAAIVAPAATAGALAGGMVGGAASGAVADAAGATPRASALISDAGGLIGGVAGGYAGLKIPSGNPVTGLKNMMAGPPEAQMTKALQPAKNNIGFGADLKTALPQMKAAEQQLGKPIEGFDDAAQAAILAKKNIWQHVQARLQGAGQQGATIDGNPIADAMMNSIDKRMGIQNPGLIAKIQSIADTYRRPLDVNEAEDFIQSNNKELTGYYAKNKVSQQAAEADPEIAAKVAEGNALRSALYDKLDSLSGPGVAQLKKTYGALSNVQKELTAQQIVYARKAPVSLGEQLGYLQAAGKALTGDVVGAAKDIAVRRFLSDLNDKNSMITRSFANVQPAGPFPAPSNPRFAGLLPRGAIQPPQADASGAISGAMPPTIEATTRAQRLGLLLPEKAGGNVLPYYPQMTPGEEVVSRLHQLRQLSKVNSADQMSTSSPPLKIGKFPVLSKSMKEYSDDPDSLIDELEKRGIGDDPNNSAIGLRGIYKEELGKTPRRSWHSPDGEKQYRLNGTSTIGITGDYWSASGDDLRGSIPKAMERVGQYGDTDYIALLRGEPDTEYSNDIGEQVISKPQVIAYIRRKK